MTRMLITGRILRLVLVSAVLGIAGVLPAAAEVLYVASTRIEVIDSDSGKQLAEIPLGHFVFDIAFSPDGSRAFVAVDEGVIEVDATKHTVLGRVVDGPSFHVAVSADGKLLYVLGNEVRRLADGQQEALPSHLTIYDLKSRAVVARHEVGERAREMALTSGKAVVIRPEGRELKAVNLADGATVFSTAFAQSARDEAPIYINGLATSPDGKKLYVGQFGQESQVNVVDAATGARTVLPFKHDGFITGVRTSADGQTLYVAIRNDLAVLDAATGAERAFIPLGGAHINMALSADGRRSYHTLPTADEKGNGAITVVDLASGKVERTISTPGISAVTIGVKP